MKDIAKLGLTLSDFLCIGILSRPAIFIAIRSAQYVNWNFLTDNGFFDRKKCSSRKQSGSIGGI